MRAVDGHYVADTARVVGDVGIGRDVSIWYGAVIRGDVAPVVIGAGTNVQDNAVIHCDHRYANVLGERVIIGHGAVVHGELVGDNTLIGINATVLGRTKIGKGCLIAAGAVVPPGMEVPDGSVVMGVPGKVVRGVSDADKAYLAKLPGHYIGLARRHAGLDGERPGDGVVFEMGEVENLGLMPE